ncbi:MAG: hypothetical protein A2632_00805 [Candidatus Pacebacteria bacterium RIFCSPHIGHO2_01_FULL_46_16]|nr:MAG: hypothetical protein A2632_00805 [Candidatus Pacebacteria bacterium RIFCSPHIGHO2_01_FULL_46_16]
MTAKTSKPLSLGILGLSPGNGHPYSWSAIFNGYDIESMRSCPFPVISQYLAQQTFPQDQIIGARVTHIWTQDQDISKNVSQAAKIPIIVADPHQFIGAVDAILLARDDAENHWQMSKDFLRAGLPIYIDKPLAFDLKTAKKILNMQQYSGQVFTGSALSFAKEFQITPAIKSKVGTINRIEANISKDWLKYSIHIIDPVLNMIKWQDEIIGAKTKMIAGGQTTAITWPNSLTTVFTVTGKKSVPITIDIRGETGTKRLEFTDTYSAFKNSLQTFIDIIQKKVQPPSTKRILKAVEIIERGVQS